MRPTLLALLGLLPACWTFNPQTDFVQRTFFPSPPPPLTAVELPTPAFAKSRGFTKHSELMDFLEELAAAHPDTATLTTVGESQRGRAIPMMRIVGRDPKIRVFLQGGLHGNEPASTEGLLLLVHRLLEDERLRSLRAHLDVAVVPVANPDGYERQLRYAANGLDLNRDQTKLEVPESTVLKKAFHKVDPAVAVDFHEYRPYRRDFLWLGENGVTSAYDVMFLYSGNLNVPEPLRDLTRDVFVADVNDEMQQRGLRYHDYVVSREVHGDIWFNQGSSQARSSATNWALADTVSLLVEVRGVALGRDAFERRVLSTFWVAERVLRTARDHADRVHQVLEQSIGQPAQVAVTQSPAVLADQIQVIDLVEHAIVDLDITLRDNLRSSATLTRPRPEAYAILPGSDELVGKLEVLGLELVTLEAETSFELEAYEVADVRREPFRYEGQRQQDVTVDLVAARESLPAGSTLVRLDRPGANIALEVLEPESPNSFVSFGVVRARPGTRLPFVRVTGGAAEVLSSSSVR